MGGPIPLANLRCHGKCVGNGPIPFRITGVTLDSGLMREAIMVAGTGCSALVLKTRVRPAAFPAVPISASAE